MSTDNPQNREEEDRLLAVFDIRTISDGSLPASDVVQLNTVLRILSKKVFELEDRTRDADREKAEGPAVRSELEENTGYAPNGSVYNLRAALRKAVVETDRLAREAEDRATRLSSITDESKAQAEIIEGLKETIGSFSAEISRMRSKLERVAEFNHEQGWNGELRRILEDAENVPPMFEQIRQLKLIHRSEWTSGHQRCAEDHEKWPCRSARAMGVAS